MATHSSILAQRIPWTEEPGGRQSMGLQKELDIIQQLNNNMRICIKYWAVEMAWLVFSRAGKENSWDIRDGILGKKHIDESTGGYKV